MTTPFAPVIRTQAELEAADGLAHTLLHLTPGVDPDGRWALLCSRPGAGGTASRTT